MPLTTCPECHSAMQVVARGEVFIDVCPSCRGVWLDGGELEKIIIQTRENEAERLVDEERAEGRRPTSDRGHGDWDDGDDWKKSRGKEKDKKKKKKRGFFDLGDLGDLVGDFF